jgi:hypothetical protein
VKGACSDDCVTEAPTTSFSCFVAPVHGMNKRENKSCQGLAGQPYGALQFRCIQFIPMHAESVIWMPSQDSELAYYNNEER